MMASAARVSDILHKDPTDIHNIYGYIGTTAQKRLGGATK